jgi:CRISPR-associated protein Cas2
MVIMKQFIVVAYDISDDRRRQQVAKTLTNFGVRCNFSVFECALTESQIKTMQKRLNKIADPQGDSILYYYLCKSCLIKREVFGQQSGLRSEIVWI